MADYDSNMQKMEQVLKPKLTDAFLADLVIAMKTCGWSVDAVETIRFVEWCFDLAEKPRPSAEELEPYDYDKYPEDTTI